MNAAVHHLHKMTADQYQAERQQIEATYGANAKEANGLREQMLAALYHRTGWTQEELAKAEGCGKSRISQWLLFGRFLAFSTSGGNAGKQPRNLTERRFRSYWERTTGGNERQRFDEVLRLIDHDTRIVRPQTKKPEVGRAIVDKFADGKWHGEQTIKAHVDAPPEDVDAVLDTMRAKGTYGVQCERRQAGKTHQYRIVKGGGKRIDAAALIQELRPLLDGLYAEGKKNPAHISGGEVQTLAGRIEKLIERLAK